MINKLDKYLTTKNISWFIFLSILISHLLILLSNDNAVITWFNNDDVFYYFKVAQNVAEGNGFSFDGINLSNGFHPLWMFICIPIFSLAKYSLVLPLKIIIFILAFFHAGAGIFLYRMIKRVLPNSFAILISFSWIYSVYVHKAYIIGGLESGISSFFIIFLWERISYLIQNKSNEKIIPFLWKLGFIATLATLSRLDNVFLVFFGGVWLWTSLWNNPVEKGDQGWLWRFKTGTAYYLPVVATMLVYLAWNKIVFGTFMPVSGQVKLWWGSFYDTVYGLPPLSFAEVLLGFVTDDGNSGPFKLVTKYLIDFGEWLMPIIGQDPKRLMVKRFLIMLAMLGTILGYSLKGVKQFFTPPTIKLGLPFYLSGTLMHVLYYKGLGGIGQRSWYWVMENIFLTIFIGILIYTAWQYLRKFKHHKTLEYGVIFVAVSFLLFQFGNHIQARRRLAFDDVQHEYVETASLIDERFPVGSIIGLTGSGGMGYFVSNHTIINLDGLINSYEYFESMKNGTADEFLANLGLEYVIGNSYMINQSSPYRQIFEGHLTPSLYKFPIGGVWDFTP
jgi:hypothetical protein